MIICTRKQARHALVSCLLLGAAMTANAVDIWDAAGGDGSGGTDNELIHGSDQVHDLESVGGVQDEDWFRLSQAPYSSYEVIVDGLTEPVAQIPVTTLQSPLQVDEVDGMGNVVTAGRAATVIGSARSLRIRNTGPTEIDTRFIRVRTGADGDCTTTCTSTAQYRIRFRETTLMIPRFNNTSTQITVLIMQNGSRDTVNATARFWSPAGALLASQPFTMPPRGGFVLSTPTVSGANGVSGMMTVEHDGRFGEVTGKSVALEPATGFSFDSPGVPRLP